MATVRRCATKGCPGILIVASATHCPRCGGTQFVRERSVFRRVMLLGVLPLLVIAGAMLIAESRLRVNSAPLPAGRQALVDAHEVAAQITAPNARDEAYGDIVRRALGQRDYEYACEVGSEMTIPSNKDKCLVEVVEEALRGGQPDWATRAAGQMVSMGYRDAAFRRIMNARGARQGPVEGHFVE